MSLVHLRTTFTTSFIALAILASNVSTSRGEEATLGVAKMDADNNGVRDDVQAVIAAHSAGDETKFVVLMRKAIIEEQMLASARDIDRLTALAAMLSKEHMCSPDAFSRKDKKIAFELDYYEAFHNSAARREADHKVEVALSSLRVPLAMPSDCD